MVDVRRGGKKSNKFIPVFDINDDDFVFYEPEFLVKDLNSRPVINLTVRELSEAYLPDTIIHLFTSCTNNYVDARKRKEPELAMWKRDFSRRVTAGEIFHFIAIIQYMDIIRCPCKKYYWSKRMWMPPHPVCQAY